MKNILIFFDGTGNEPGDAVQDREWFGLGDLEDESISNVLKLHLLFGGDLDNSNNEGDQLCFYYSGVGTYGGKIRRTINSMFGFQNLDVERIQNQAYTDLSSCYNPGDRLFVFGFSRGAAIARQFCSRRISRLVDEDNPQPVKFLGVFDTVAAINFPNLNNKEFPVSDVVFEDRYISKTIEKALHLVSLDDKRKAFQPTLMNYEDRVREVWFTGAHSDIGGGFRRDGLSDITLQFMLDYIREQDYGFTMHNPRNIDYAAMLDDDDVRIDFNDVMLNPNPFGHIHLQKRSYFASKITLGNRPLVVMENEQPSSRQPYVHHTVAERIYGEPDYKPQSMYQTPHQVYWQEGASKTFDGLAEHRTLGRAPRKVLEVGASKTVRVYANRKYNQSGILLSKNHQYCFDVDLDQYWHDSAIRANAEGWDTRDENIDLGWAREALIRRKEEDRRVPDAQWFEICAAVGESENELFRILQNLCAKERNYQPRTTGEFCPFANDLLDRYGNNLGYIDVSITRTE